MPDCLATAEEMFDVFTESIRPLPLADFISFLSPAPKSDSSAFDPVSLACLIQMLLRPLLTASPPPYAYKMTSQPMLEESFLPFAANSSSVVDNAKVAVLLETLTRLIWRSGELEWSSILERALEAGVAVREEKAFGDDRRRSGPPKQTDVEASKWLRSSPARLRMIAGLCKTRVCGESFQSNGHV